MEKINFEVRGMSCGHCVASVKEAIEKVDGARVDRVDVGSADISYDPAVTSTKALEDAIRDAGYEVAATGQAPL